MICKCGSTGPFAKDRTNKSGFSSVCKACRCASAKAWNAAHVGLIRQRALDWNKQHPERTRKRRRSWALAHPEKVKASYLLWLKRHPTQQGEYRAARRNAVRTLTPEQWAETLEYFDYRCAYCLVDIRDLPSRSRSHDHIVAISLGGGHTQDNVVPCCSSCNSRKGGRPVFIMARFL